MRETLFNWLASSISGSRCGDLFAGTGVLGLEAISRGCKELIMIDSEPSVCNDLRELLEKFGADGDSQVICADAVESIVHLEGKFDIVFLDPPFAKQLLTPSLEALKVYRKLHRGGLVYVEMEHGPSHLDGISSALTSGYWSVWRSGRTKKTDYALLASPS